MPDSGTIGARSTPGCATVMTGAILEPAWRASGLTFFAALASRLVKWDKLAESIEAARAYCHGDVYQLIIKVRGLMRQDLGVSEPADQPG